MKKNLLIPFVDRIQRENQIPRKYRVEGVSVWKKNLKESPKQSLLNQNLSLLQKNDRLEW